MKCPEGTIVVRRLEDERWVFKYPRLWAAVYEDFRWAIDNWEHGEVKEAEAIYRRLIEEYPEFIDAYHHLAILLRETAREKEASEMWREAVAIGMEALPEGFRMGRDLLPWGFHNNRPFLRAFHALGLEHLERGSTREALEVFNALLGMSPNDNQGVRAVAIGCNLELGRPHEVLNICRCYPQDTMPHVLYGEVLALYQIEQESRARQALMRAVSLLPRVADELVKTRHQKPKDAYSGHVMHGGVDEAYYYWRSQGKYWEKTVGAVALVKSFLETCPDSDSNGPEETEGGMSSEFDIHSLEGVDLDTEEGELRFKEYVEKLVRLYRESPEGKEHLHRNHDAGSWAPDLMEFGCYYLGVLLPEMTVDDVEQILTDLIPRKVVLSSPDEAEEIVPDLIGFWEYIKREYGLPNSDSILKYLGGIGLEFPRIMNDSSRFGMSKSLFRMGEEEGFDMSSEEGMAAFFEAFNARRNQKDPGTLGLGSDSPEQPHITEVPPKKNKDRKRSKKAKRKAAKKSRKANRPKRK